MDFDTAMELVADRDGSVDWELVKEASWWLIDNGYDKELRELVLGTMAKLYEEVKAEPSRGKNERDI
jgi:hypothetical protein